MKTKDEIANELYVVDYNSVNLTTLQRARVDKYFREQS
jgi:hypothetical protein